jgi:hypothetical protein
MEGPGQTTLTGNGATGQPVATGVRENTSQGWRSRVWDL